LQFIKNTYANFPKGLKLFCLGKIEKRNVQKEFLLDQSQQIDIRLKEYVDMMFILKV
jgi:hypothetical protein